MSERASVDQEPSVETTAVAALLAAQGVGVLAVGPSEHLLQDARRLRLPVPAIGETIEASEADLGTPAGALCQLRTALRKERNGIYGYSSPPHDLQALLETCMSHDNPFVKKTDIKILNNFIATVNTFYQRCTDVGRPDRQQMHGMALLYLQDVGSLTQQGIPRPDKVAFYHGPTIWSEVQEATAAHGLPIATSNLKLLLKQHTQQPIRAVGELAAKVSDFRESTEPKLREEYGYTAPWSDSLVVNKFLRLSDATGYFRHQLKGRSALRDAYPWLTYDEINNSLSWQAPPNEFDYRVTICNRKPEEIALTEQQIVTGREQFIKLLGVKDRKGQTPNFWLVHELARQLRANKGRLDAGIEIDIDWAARFIVGNVERHNRQAERPGALIPNDLPTLYGIFNAYLRNVLDLRSILGADTERMATWVTAAEYKELITNYASLTNMTDSQIHKIARRSIQNPEQTLSPITTLQTKGAALCGGLLSKKDINRLIVTQGADRNRVTTALRRYMASFPETYARTVAACPQATKKDVQWFFLETHEPISKALQWADDVQHILEWPSRVYISYGVAVQLMRHRGQTDIDTVMKNYHHRIDHMENTCRVKGKRVPRPYIMYWAARRPNSYERSIDDFLETRTAIRENIEAAGEEIDDDTTLSVMAFRHPRASDAETTAQRFISLRTILRNETEGNPWVAGWMIDGAAASFRLRYARQQLAWLMRLMRLDALKLSSRSSLNDTISQDGSSGTWSVETVTASKDTCSVQESATNSIWLENLLDPLLPVEAAAIKCIYGIPAEYSEEELAETLGVEVNDLEQFVQTNLMPKVQAILTGRQQAQAS